MSSIKTTTGTLAAGARRDIPSNGSFIYLRSALDSNGADSQLVVSLQEIELGQKTGHTTKLIMSSGDKIRPQKRFDSVVLFNDTSLAIDYEAVHGDGDYDRPIPDTVNVSVSTPSAKGIETAPDVTVSGTTNATADVIAAANTNRVRIVLTALDTNDQILRIGGADVDADEGIQLAAGQSVALLTTAEILGCEEVAGTNAVSVFEETLS